MLIRIAERRDAQEILRWRNDPQTRAMSRADAPIDAQSHQIWFERVLRCQDRLLIVGVLSGNAAGMVRFDRQNKVTDWEISIVLAPEERGKGLGRELLTLALSHFFVKYPESVLLAEIKPGNVSSRRLFESAGFLHESNDGEMLQFFLRHNENY